MTIRKSDDRIVPMLADTRSVDEKLGNSGAGNGVRYEEVRLRRILNEQRDRLPCQSPVSRLDVRSENIFELDLRVVKEAIGTVIISARSSQAVGMLAVEDFESVSSRDTIRLSLRSTPCNSSATHEFNI